MKLTLCILLSLILLTKADISRLERWPVMEIESQNTLDEFFGKLKNTIFPAYSYTNGGFLFSNTMIIKDFKFINIEPRYDFMTVLFNQKENMYTIYMPLGFHISAEFLWVYNAFIIPISGSATFDNDVQDFQYNVTINFNDIDKILIITNISYSLINPSEIATSNLIGGDKLIGAESILLKAIKLYYPHLYDTIKISFHDILVSQFLKNLQKSMSIRLSFPSFHVIKEISLKLSGINTHNALVYNYGSTAQFQDLIKYNESISRQYCVDKDMIITVINEAWSQLKAIYRNSDLSPNCIYKLTVIGLSQLIPDILTEYPRNANVNLNVVIPKVTDSNIELRKLNDTHSLARNFLINLKYEVNSDFVLELKLKFDMIIYPLSKRNNNGYIFNLEAMEAIIQPNIDIVNSKYRSIIHSNVRSAAAEFIKYLLLPLFGYRV